MNYAIKQQPDIPLIVLALGYAGLLPFITLASALWFEPGDLQIPLNEALLSYSAIILSFMGAIHWGLAMKADDTIGNTQLALSVIAPLSAWIASLTPVAINYSLLIICFTILCLYDVYMVRVNKAPSWYSRLRIPLTVIVVISLIAAVAANTLKHQL